MKHLAKRIDFVLTDNKTDLRFLESTATQSMNSCQISRQLSYRD
jgi:hypothetical protein